MQSSNVDLTGQNLTWSLLQHSIYFPLLELHKPELCWTSHHIRPQHFVAMVAIESSRYARILQVTCSKPENKGPNHLLKHGIGAHYLVSVGEAPALNQAIASRCVTALYNLDRNVSLYQCGRLWHATWCKQRSWVLLRTFQGVATMDHVDRWLKRSPTIRQLAWSSVAKETHCGMEWAQQQPSSSAKLNFQELSTLWFSWSGLHHCQDSDTEWLLNLTTIAAGRQYIHAVNHVDNSHYLRPSDVICVGSRHAVESHTAHLRTDSWYLHGAGPSQTTVATRRHETETGTEGLG